MGSITIPSGTRGYGALPVAKMSSGFTIDIPMHIISGDPSGPVLCIMACVHAHEYTAIDTIRQLVLNIEPTEISGTLIAIPVVNTMAFSMVSRGNWFDGMWGPSGDLGRAAPGNPRGWIVERIAQVLTNEVVPKTDVMIDFHGEAPNRRNYIYYPYIRKGNKGYSRNYRDYVENLGTDLLVEVESSGAGATTAQVLEELSEAMSQVMQLLEHMQNGSYVPASSDDGRSAKAALTDTFVASVKQAAKPGLELG